MNAIPWDDPHHDTLEDGDHDSPPRGNPRCALYGAEMAIMQLEGDAIVWQCDGIAYWDKWDRAHRSPGRRRNDAHSVQSKVKTARA